MNFDEQIIEFCDRVKVLKDQITTEEATKMSLILPLFQILGYNVFDPEEFLPEYTADVGIKKREKVDYAIMKDGTPKILIEAKWCGDNLEKHSSQLFRYFGTSDAKFAILTNGIKYNFYTDLDEANKMDLSPFLEVNLLNFKQEQIAHLKKFHKDNFNSDEVFDIATRLKYYKAVRQTIAQLVQNPSDDFVKLILSSVYQGRQTQNVIEKYKTIVQKSFIDYVNDLVNERITAALNDSSAPKKTSQKSEPPLNISSATPAEIECFYLIRSILSEVLSRDLVTYKHTDSYLTILYNNSVRKWICRIILDTEKKQILFPNGNKGYQRFYMDNINDIYTYKPNIFDSVQRILSNKASVNSPPVSEENLLQSELITTTESASCKELTKGMRIKNAELQIETGTIVNITLDKVQRPLIDVSCFCVNDEDQIIDEQYFIFYNQTESPEGAIKMLLGEHGTTNSIAVDFSKLPKNVKKLIFTLSLDGNFDMSDLKSSSISFLRENNNIAQYNFDGSQFTHEKALILAEFYFKNDCWSLSIVGHGFNGGLDALLTHFGGIVEN